MGGGLMTAKELARFPFVARRDIVRAYRPGTEASEASFRTLRSNGLVSPGIEVRRRRAGKLSGQLRCYSVLNVDAVVLARQDRLDEAAQVVAAATSFENEWQPFVARLVEEFELADFTALRAARNTIAHSLEPLTADLEAIRTKLGQAIAGLVSEEFVRISAISTKWAMLDIIQPDLTDTSKVLNTLNEQWTKAFAVDALLPLSAGLGLGDLAVLRIEHSAGASLVSLLAGIEDDTSNAGSDEFSPYLSDEPLSDDLRHQLDRARADDKVTTVPPRVVPLAS
jgi:hypothetical protein